MAESLIDEKELVRRAVWETQVSVKSATADTVTLAGYGIVFGGIDLDGEMFSADTDYMPDLVPSKLVFYDHAQNAVKHIIGKTSSIVADEFGLWVEAELNRHAEYVSQITALAEKGVLGWSSGAVGHLSLREGKAIKRWPIVEFSLTPTPAEPRTLGVDVIKSMAEADESFAALLPGDAGKASEQDEANTAAEALGIELDIMELED